MQPVDFIDDTTAFAVVVSLSLGGFITWFFAKRYYEQASEDLRTASEELRQETENVRHYVDALITYLEAAGQITVRRDPATGRPLQTQITERGVPEPTVRFHLGGPPSTSTQGDSS